MAAIKDDLIKAVQANLRTDTVNYSKVDCDRFIDAVVQGILQVAQQGEMIRTPIGTFRWAVSEACTRRNPRTGEPVDVPAFATLKFTASKTIRQASEVQEAPAVKVKETPVAAKPRIKQLEIKATVGKRK